MRFKVYFNANVTSDNSHYFVKLYETIEEAEASTNLLADYTLFLQENCLMSDYSNIAFIEFLNDDGVWEDWDLS